jgi:hypothetical protein
MAAKEKPTPTGRPIVLKSRQATFRGHKTITEMKGQDRLARADVDLELTIADADRDQILLVDGGAAVLWNADQQPILVELEGWITLTWQAEGLASLGPVRGEQTKFEEAVLKNVKVKLELGGSMQMRCTLNVASDGEAELLQRLHCVGLCKLSFKGNKLMPTAPPEGDEQQDLLDDDRDEEA